MGTYNGAETYFPTVNWEPTPRLAYRRAGDKLDTKTGRWDYDDRSGGPRLERPYSLWLHGRPAVLALLQWAERRKGRAVPFWMPSYRRDMSVHAAGTAGDTGLLIAQTGYALRQFPHLSRRHIVIGTASELTDSMVYQVTAASDAGDHTGVTLTPSLRTNVPLGTPVMFFHLFRLASDKVGVKWLTASHAECSLDVIELPKEYPA